MRIERQQDMKRIGPNKWHTHDWEDPGDSSMSVRLRGMPECDN